MSLPESQVVSSGPARFEGRAAIVTGSGRGIGFQAARILHSEGASVVINDIDQERLARAAEALGPDLDRVAAAPINVSDPDAVGELVSIALSRFGHIDILVNVVGGSYGAPHRRLMEFDLVDWYNLLNLNLTSVFLCANAAIPEMRKTGGGAIVSVSSTAGVRGEPGLWNPVYCAAKAGVQGLTRALALEYGKDNIRANCVAQSDVLSERTYDYLTGAESGYFEDEATARERFRQYPTPRMGEPVEVAAVICFLASKDASYVNGETVLITGGSYMAP